MPEFPVPSNAAYIWLVGDTINLGLPPIGEGTKGHTICVPATVVGLTALLDLLRERARGVRFIGYPSDPTQWQFTKAVDELLKSRKRVDEKAKREAGELLEGLF